MNHEEIRLRHRMGAALDAMKAIRDAAAERPLTKAQATDFETHLREITEIRVKLGDDDATFTDKAADGPEFVTKVIDDLEAKLSRVRPLPMGILDTGRGKGAVAPDGTVRALTKGERLADIVGSDRAFGGGSLSMASYVKAVVTGDWRDLEVETKAQSEGLGSAGGFLVPPQLSARVIDRARAQAVVMRAGALTIPMEESELSIARLATGVTTGWKSENAPIVASDMTFERVTFRARTLTALIKASVELVEDALQLEETVETELAGALALELDRACLRGTGAANEPLGISNQPGIGTTAVGGALSRYANVVSTVRDIRIQNFEPDFLILSPRTRSFYDGLEDTTNQPLRPPEVWDQLQKLSTTSVPTNLGGGSDTEVYYGKGSEILVGVPDPASDRGVPPGGRQLGVRVLGSPGLGPRLPAGRHRARPPRRLPRPDRRDELTPGDDR